MQWLNRNQKFNKTVFQKKKPQKWKRTKTKPHKKSFLTVCHLSVWSLCIVFLKIFRFLLRGEKWFLAVIGYAICLIQIYVAKPLWFSLYENTFLFLEDKWELPMGSRGTVILLLFGVKKNCVNLGLKTFFQKNIWDCFYKDLEMGNLFTNCKIFKKNCMWLNIAILFYFFILITFYLITCIWINIF